MVSLTSTDQLITWQGVAGSGKSFALRQVFKTAKAVGYQVYALGPDGVTAKALGESIGAQSSTVSRFFIKEGRSVKNALFIVDEASKLSTLSANTLIDLAKKTNSRVIFVGDKRQYTGVEAGNPFSILYKHASSKAELNEHRRQRHDAKSLKKAVDLASQQTPDSLRGSMESIESKIIERKTGVGRLRAFVKLYNELSADEQKNTLLLADTNSERSALIAKLRSSLKKSGRIGCDDVNIPILLRKDLTKSEARDAINYDAGDIVMAATWSCDLKLGEYYEVVKQGEGKLTLQSRLGFIKELDPSVNELNAYSKSMISVSSGDKLEWRKNQGQRVNRAEISVVSTDTKSILVEDVRGVQSRLSLDEFQHLDHALVKTSYSSQGATAERVIALSTKQASLQSWYVSLSRAKSDVHIITDSKDLLLARINQSKQQANILDKHHKTDRPFMPQRAQDSDKGLKQEIEM